MLTEPLSVTRTTAMTLPQRRSVRLPGYDYTQAGAYFVTLCTHNRAWLFGQIIDACGGPVQ
jgi:hypothetical protein